jgi:RNA polymerase sigma-70 factor (ECF subfamily)
MQQEQPPQFVSLFTRYQREIYAYVAMLVPGWNEADEVMQETSVILWEKFSTFVPGTNFVAWACKIAYYRALHRRRTQARDRHQFSADFEAVAAGLTDTVEQLESRRRALAHCVEKLPGKDQTLLKACYAEGGTIKQAAEALRHPVKAVYKSLARIRRALLQCAERRLLAEEAG